MLLDMIYSMIEVFRLSEPLRRRGEHLTETIMHSITGILYSGDLDFVG